MSVCGICQDTPQLGLCAFCLTRIKQTGTFEALGHPASHWGDTWRTVTGTELHELLHVFARGGLGFGCEVKAVRVDEEQLPMLAVTVVDGVPCCAVHVNDGMAARVEGDGTGEMIGFVAMGDRSSTRVVGIKEQAESDAKQAAADRAQAALDIKQAQTDLIEAQRSEEQP